MSMKECVLSGVAILAIGGLTAYALFLGHDGALLQAAIAIIAGLAGYQIARRTGGGKSNGSTPTPASPPDIPSGTSVP